MNIVPSRFACLNIDDDDISNKGTRNRGNVVQKENFKENQNKVLTLKSQKKSTNIKQDTKQPQIQKRHKLPKQHTEKQWEEWKEKDKKLVDGKFEQDLENAIFLSKIHYEQNKDKYKGDNNDSQKKTEKKKKSKTITLDQFLTGEAAKPQKIDANHGSFGESVVDRNFFEKISKDAKSEYTKDRLNERVRERQIEIDEVITSSQYQEKLSIERKKNEALQQELNKTKEEIAGVKERNKTLYTLLSTGEMKGKVEIINELEKLNVIKDELTQEVTRLHGLLEQERSKVAALMDSKHKKNGKKHS